MAHFTVVLDSCVLYSAPLRDLLLSIALTDLYRARWTEMIHEEWMRSLIKNKPNLSREKLERTRDTMNKCVMDCLVTGYESLIPSLILPDPDDRHVLAAAIRAKADMIVTYNLTDFPEEALAPYEIEAQHPDDFLNNQFSLASHLVCKAAKGQRARLTRPPMTVDEFLTSLEKQRLPQTVANLRKFADVL